MTTTAPTTGQTTLYPLPMLEQHSMRAAYANIYVTQAAAGETLDMGIYVLSRELNRISRLPGSLVSFDCGTIGLRNERLPSEVTLLPRQLYFVGFHPSAGLTLRVVEQLVAPYKSVRSSIADTLTLSDKQPKLVQQIPWVELLSTWGNKAL